MGDPTMPFTIATATGAAWLALMIHFGGGLVGLVSGFIAVVARKGGRWHRLSGDVFVVAMVILGVTGAGIAAAEGSIGSVLGGGITVYFVLTGFMTLRPAGGRHRNVWAVALMAVAFAVALPQLYYGFVALGRPRMMLNGVPGPMILFLGTVSLLAAVGDLRLLRSGDITGSRRMARHLWRMCFALFIASGSFFFGQMNFLPEALRIMPLLTLLGVGPLLVLVPWMWRIRLRHRLQGLELRGSGATP